MLEPIKLLLRDHAGIQELLHVQELGGRILRTLSLGGGLLLRLRRRPGEHSDI